MNARRAATTVALWAIALGGVAWLLTAGAHAPERIATHFDFSGKPDAWSERGTFLVSYSALLVGLAALMHGGAFIINMIPPSMINLPNGEFWLERERLAATRAFLFDWMLLLAVATAALLAELGREILAYATTAEGERGALPTPAVLVVYFAFMAVWLAALFVRFRKPESQSAAATRR